MVACVCMGPILFPRSTAAGDSLQKWCPEKKRFHSDYCLVFQCPFFPFRINHGPPWQDNCEIGCAFLGTLTGNFLQETVLKDLVFISYHELPKKFKRRRCWTLSEPCFVLVKIKRAFVFLTSNQLVDDVRSLILWLKMREPLESVILASLIYEFQANFFQRSTDVSDRYED